MTEEEIRNRIKELENRKQGYLEADNTKRANAIQKEIYKWENLLDKLDGKLEKRIFELEHFIKSKDLWESFLHWRV